MIDEHYYGPDHPRLATSLNNLASLLLYSKKLNEAEPIIRRAIAILEKTYGLDHPDVTYPLNTLALVLMEADRLAEAASVFRRAEFILSQNSEKSGYDHPNRGTVARNYLSLLQRMDREP